MITSLVSESNLLKNNTSDMTQQLKEQELSHSSDHITQAISEISTVTHTLE
ncbi:hypothetical protein PBV87_16830 [Niameybacter massiliensis]|uniref:Uncharacterized protein n=1 Tax=Holtiella tumoricola TaxID=3018743 RepID=A0AA42J2F9_9FIRM|nr:hypothetical protein [Holtiella tumoricola]MDA3733143.1 hypothetical protein [Holtiella tumoricola]